MCMICENTDLSNTIRLDCSGCQTIEVISNLPKLEYLTCEDCPNLKKISYLSNLETLNCAGCLSVKEISNMPKLKYLDVRHCRLLLAIPNTTRQLTYDDNPWLDPEYLYFQIYRDTPNSVSFVYAFDWLVAEHMYKIDAVKTLQRFVKRNFKYFVFKNWTKSRAFAEWFYAPDQLGGRVDRHRFAKIMNKGSKPV